MGDMSWVVLIFCIFILAVIGIYQSRLTAKDDQAHTERMFLWEQAERERNQLLNRSMAKDLSDYRQSVAVEAAASTDPEAKLAEERLNMAYGNEWREMT